MLLSSTLEFDSCALSAHDHHDHHVHSLGPDPAHRSFNCGSVLLHQRHTLLPASLIHAGSTPAEQLQQLPPAAPALPALLLLLQLAAAPAAPAAAAALQQQQQQLQSLFELGEGLETPIQLIYLLTLLGFLAAGAYLVVRQVSWKWLQTRRLLWGAVWVRGCTWSLRQTHQQPPVIS